MFCVCVCVCVGLLLFENEQASESKRLRVQPESHSDYSAIKALILSKVVCLGTKSRMVDQSRCNC
jgi:hypothetical protein